MENKRKKNPLTVIIHHIKSPIFILKSYLETVASGDLGELNSEQKKYINVCLENTKKITGTMEELVSLMEIEDNIYEVKKEKIDIMEVAKKAIEENLILLRAGNTKISINSSEDSIFVLGDFEKIKNVFNSLINNSIKYKKQGEGKIEIIIKKDEDDEKAICSVKDNGVGIDEEEKETVFKKFYRAQKAIEIDPNSLGIELYINKKIIENLGGSIWAENNPEGGAVFSFSLLLYKN